MGHGTNFQETHEHLIPKALNRLGKMFTILIDLLN